MKDTFNFKLSKPIEVNIKDNDGKLFKCESLTLSCPTYRHSDIELQLEQLFMDGQFNLANKASNLINNKDSDKEEKEAISQNNIFPQAMPQLGH